MILHVIQISESKHVFSKVEKGNESELLSNLCTRVPRAETSINCSQALEILKSATASPALSRFGKSPMIKELRITDSPFPLSNGDEDGDQVDEAAEKFIMRFYNSLREEN
ncbi:hypothetical protein Tco_0450274 [Tanacetum coccineum]